MQLSQTIMSHLQRKVVPTAVLAGVGGMMVIIVTVILMVILLIIFLVRKNRHQKDG